MADPQTASDASRTDAQLWDGVLAADGDAFAALYDRYVDVVHRVLARRVGPAEAPDLTAEVFVRAWTKRSQIRLADPGGLAPWLLGTALNVARQHADRASAAHRLSERMAQLATTADDPIDSAIETLDDTDALAHAHAALASLSAEDQEVLVLCVLEGVPPTEAAEALDLRPGSVRSRLSRARRRLAVAYEQSWTGGRA